MYVRLTHLKFFADKIEEAKKTYNEELIPSIRQQEGIIDVMLLQPVDNVDD